MLRFTPILLAVLYAYILYRFSAWNTARNLDANSSLLRDPKLVKLTERMAQSLDLPNIKVFIYEVEPVNGLASPDGRIFLTRGFLKQYQQGIVSAEELASVIAHELGHVALGHSKRRMIDFSGQNALRTALGMVLGRFIPFVGFYIAQFLTTILAARLSRQDEYEADSYASALLVKSGIGTAPQISLFEKLDQMTSGPAGQPGWLLSHPKTNERIAAIKKREESWNTP